jgi:glutathione transport system ATP-binding protein
VTLASPSGGGSAGPATAAAPLLEVRDLKVTFPSEAGPVTAVRGISYTVEAGEVLAIVGESGSGKSVSSLAMMGLLPAKARVSGSVKFRGTELINRPDKEMSGIRGAKISMVFQDPLSALTPVYTVGDQIAEAIRIHNDVGKEVANRRAVELLEIVGIPNPRQRAHAFPHEFSGGMRQRAMIAIAIANDPDLIIADEPTTALDVTIQAQILEVLQKAREVTGAAVIMITHDLGVVAGFADRVAVMYAGRVVETGSVDDVYYRPRMPYTLGLLGSIPRLDAGERTKLTPIEGTPPSLVGLPVGCPFAPRCPMRIQICVEQEPPLAEVGAGVGHRAACHRSDEIATQHLTGEDMFAAESFGPPAVASVPREERQVVLEVQDMAKHYPLTKGVIMRRRIGTVHAVDGISFDLREGETLGLVGESGCGKTTTIMEILGLARPTAGRVLVLGRDTGRMPKDQKFAVRRDLQVVFQDPLASLDPRLPVIDILTEPMATHRVPGDEQRRRALDLLRTVGLRPEHANRYPSEFSGGQRQRIGIARALALHPRIVVLDEPVSALDVSIRAGVINLLEQLREERGLSYLFVAHDLSVVRHIADRVAVMYLGRFSEIGEVNEVFDRPSHPYTQALLSAIPLPDPVRERARERIVLTGDLPSPADPPSGCRFRTRCQWFARELTPEQQTRCVEIEPPLIQIGAPGTDHQASCHYAQARSVL